MDIEKTSSGIGKWIYNLLIEWGIDRQWTSFVYTLVMLALIIASVYLTLIVVKKIMIFAFSKITNISKVPFFGYLANNKFPPDFDNATPHRFSQKFWSKS
ncbi:MAG: hypothetical protein LBH60_01315 [Prevotellaceae bacterium]|nr:hypothetical protein [Prevotellaceae bacterium]